MNNGFRDGVKIPEIPAVVSLTGTNFIEDFFLSPKSDEAASSVSNFISNMNMNKYLIKIEFFIML
jgi:hypothetical protein